MVEPEPSLLSQQISRLTQFGYILHNMNSSPAPYLMVANTTRSIRLL